jgi:hypothetical protein
MADFLEEKKREIQTRLEELRPLVEEFHRLEAAAGALEGLPAGKASGGRQAARGRRPARGASAGGQRGQRGRPRGSGTRSKQALELIRSRHGITIGELAETMGIQQNYLYRVLPGLEKDGQVRKEGKGWYPTDAV